MLARDPRREPQRQLRHVSEILGELAVVREARSRARAPREQAPGGVLPFRPVARQFAVPRKVRA